MNPKNVLNYVLSFCCLQSIGFPLLDSGESQIIALIQHQANAIAALDKIAFKADWIDGGSIMDDLPPHLFIGSGFQETWFNAYQMAAANNQLKNIKVRVAKAKKIEITGDVAYAVVPATFLWKEKNKSMIMNLTWTFALKNIDGKWRIASWAIGSNQPRTR